MSAERTVGFVGLGAMGAHMVARLIDAGHHVAVFDTRAEAMAPHVARGAQGCASAARGRRRRGHRAGQPADAGHRPRGRGPARDGRRHPGLRRPVDDWARGRRRGGGGPERGRRRLPGCPRERRCRGRAGRDADDHGRRRRGAVRLAAPVARDARAQRRARGRRARPGPAGEGPQQPALGQRDRDHRRGSRAGRARWPVGEHAARRLQLEQRAQHRECGQVPTARAAADVRRRASGSS